MDWPTWIRTSPMVPRGMMMTRGSSIQVFVIGPGGSVVELHNPAALVRLFVGLSLCAKLQREAA